MDHPYLYPDECPWLQDYHDLQALRTGRSLLLLADESTETTSQVTQEDDSDTSVSAW